MITACPHCKAALAPTRAGATPTRCPQCDRTLDASPFAAAPPGPAQATAAPSARARRWELAAVLLLAAALPAQLLLQQRDALAADARWRPAVQQWCGLTGCTLPPWREPQALRLVQRDVQAHPQRADVLRVSLRVRNTARWPQPWPRLQFTLSDVDGRPVARQRLTPAQYGAGSADAGLSPGQEAALTFDIVDPAGGSVAYDFQFL